MFNAVGIRTALKVFPCGSLHATKLRLPQEQQHG